MTGPGTSPQARLAAQAAGRALLGVAAAAAALGALAAACGPADRRPGPSVPDEEVDRVLRAAGAGGPAVAVWALNPAWVAGDPGAEPLVRDGRWVAPAGRAGAVRGTLTAGATPHAAGHLTVTAGDDAALGAALATVRPDETLVADGRDWLVVAGDRIRPLRPDAAPGGASHAVTLAEYRDALATHG
jgi:hypothetical protein